MVRASLATRCIAWVSSAPSRGLRLLGDAWTELFRNIPLLVQIFLWYHVLPTLVPSLQKVPSLVLVVDPGFKIVAQNKAHAAATLSAGKGIVGMHLFEAFPDNPGDSGAQGLSQLRASLLKVLKTKEADLMAPFRFDVQGEKGPYEERWWQVVNTPVLGDDGYVRWIINRAQDVTELIQIKNSLAKAFPKK
jgi:PAS domain-containing protein